MPPVDDPVALSRLYHLNSEPWLNDDAYRGSPYAQECKEYLHASRTALPPPRPTPVSGLVAERRSTRAFAPVGLSLDALASVVRAAYGVVGWAALDTGERFLRRSVPSAGGLYPLEFYLLLQRVQGVSEGVYHFDPRGEALELVRGGDWRGAAADAFYTWPYIADANAIVCMAAVFERCQRKYGPRGYRYILLEAGHAAQNLCLAAVERRLGTLCLGGYSDSRLNRMLELEVPREGVVYAVGLGISA